MNRTAKNFPSIYLSHSSKVNNFKDFPSILYKVKLFIYLSAGFAVCLFYYQAGKFSSL